MLHTLTPRQRVRDLSVFGDVVSGMAALPACYVGADLSLTSSGLARLRHGRVVRQLLGNPKTGTPGTLRGTARLDWLEQQLAEFLAPVKPALVAIEGYSYGSKNNREAMGEWGGVARLWLHRAGIETIVFSPNQVKKFATGNHQAKKPEVVLHLNNRWGIAEPQDDKADACVLSIMAACIAQPGCIELTKFQRDAITKKED